MPGQPSYTALPGTYPRPVEGAPLGAGDGGSAMFNVTGALQAELADLFANELHVDVPSPDTDLVATARLDSVGMVELLLQLEKRFGVRVEMQDLEIDHFRSLAAIAAFIAARRGGDQTA